MAWWRAVYKIGVSQPAAKAAEGIEAAANAASLAQLRTLPETTRRLIFSPSLARELSRPSATPPSRPHERGRDGRGLHWKCSQRNVADFKVRRRPRHPQQRTRGRYTPRNR